MTSYEWAELYPTVTIKQLDRILCEHGTDLYRFCADMGIADVYDSVAVLGWLGY